MVPCCMASRDPLNVRNWGGSERQDVRYGRGNERSPPRATSRPPPRWVRPEVMETRGRGETRTPHPGSPQKKTPQRRVPSAPAAGGRNVLGPKKKTKRKPGAAGLVDHGFSQLKPPQRARKPL